MCNCDRVTPHPLHHLRCGGDGAGNSGWRRCVPQRRQPAPRARVPVVAQRGRIYHRERRAAAAPHLTYCAAACRSAAPPPRCRPLPALLCARRSGGCATSGRGPRCTDTTACNAPPSPSSSLEPSDFLSPTAVTPAVPRVAALAMAGRPSAQAVYRLALRKIKLLEDRSAQEYYRRCVRVLGQLIDPGFTAGEHDGGEVGKEAATLRRQDALALARGRHAAHALERPRGARDRPLSKR